MTDKADPVLVLVARIEVRALLWRRGQYADLEAMMLPLYAAAKDTGVFEALGGVEGIDAMMLAQLEPDGHG